MEFKNKGLPEEIKPPQKQQTELELDFRPIIELKNEEGILKDENDKEEIDFSSLSEEEQKNLLEEDPDTYYRLLEEEALREQKEYEQSIIDGENFSVGPKEPYEEYSFDLLEETKGPKKEENLSEKEIIKRKEAADRFHVLDEKSIYEGPHGEWRFIKDDSSVQKWDELMSGNDNSDLYRNPLK